MAMTDTPPATMPGATIPRMLAPRPPFSFALALAFLRRFPPTEGERPIIDDAILGATRVGESASYAVAYTPDGAKLTTS